jgi:hypothetical protein
MLSVCFRSLQLLRFIITGYVMLLYVAAMEVNMIALQCQYFRKKPSQHLHLQYFPSIGMGCAVSISMHYCTCSPCQHTEDWLPAVLTPPVRKPDCVKKTRFLSTWDNPGTMNCCGTRLQKAFQSSAVAVKTNNYC